MRGHDDMCEYNDPRCGCARRAAERARERCDAATAFRFFELGAHVGRETFPFPHVAWPIRIELGEKFGMTRDGGFVLPRRTT